MQDKKNFRSNKLAFEYDMALQIRKMRLNSGLSLEDFSRQSGIKETAAIKLELGKICNFDHIFRIARFYDKKVKVEFY